MWPIVLALTFALPPPVAGKMPPAINVPSPVAVAPASSAPLKLLESPLSAEALRAIDERFLQRNHYQLCPGSCGMMCAAHGGGWKLEAGAADPANPNQQPAPDMAVGGHWEKRCGPNGCQQVWVADPSGDVAPPLPPMSGDYNSSSRMRWFRRR